MQRAGRLVIYPTHRRSGAPSHVRNGLRDEEEHRETGGRRSLRRLRAGRLHKGVQRLYGVSVMRLWRDVCRRSDLTPHRSDDLPIKAVLLGPVRVDLAS
jgi:hypothetical protein